MSFNRPGFLPGLNRMTSCKPTNRAQGHHGISKPHRLSGRYLRINGSIRGVLNDPEACTNVALMEPNPGALMKLTEHIEPNYPEIRANTGLLPMGAFPDVGGSSRFHSKWLPTSTALIPAIPDTAAKRTTTGTKIINNSTPHYWPPILHRKSAKSAMR
ncbi:hypothetical protein B0H19DRAFT_1081613 [Mycena capillaripes]|nr:hypothetical protein B0H19DRAFT_1081613 [Mycena capillaripes]